MNEKSNVKQSTEDVHQLSAGLDTLPIEEVLRRIHEDNARAIDSVRSAIPQIAAVVHAYATTYKEGGRIFYIGAGTSGRLGFVDAAELPATFGIPPDRVQVIFPGNIASATAEIDSREDDAEAGQNAVVEHNIGPNDLAIGITASGETPFVIGAIREAKARGARTAGIVNNEGTTLEKLVDLPIVIHTGPELIAGSTRLKAGTVQKVVLNMLSTAAMISLGKVYDGFMVGLRANNEKLRRRAVRTLTALTGQETAVVKDTLAAADYEVDTALVMLTGNLPYTEAKKLLQHDQGNMRKTLKTLEDAKRR
jgi:N-acetylmuramic acid 6-phosphate etherase